MADVRYIFGDVLTGAVIAEMPLQGVSLSSSLDGGEFRGTLFLDQTGKKNDTLVAATIPGRCYVVVERDGTPIWGGLVWTRTYQSQSKTLQLFGKDYKAYPERRFVLVDQPLQGFEQTSLFLSLYGQMQAATNSIQVILPSAISTGVTRLMEFTASEFKSYRTLLDGIADNDDGFDWLIRWSRTGGVYEQRLEIGFPTLGSPVNHGTVTFDYFDVEGLTTGGNVLNYWQNDTMAGAGTHIYGLGSGEGDLMLRSTQVHQSLIDGGFPRYDVDVSFKDVNVSEALQDLTFKQAQLRKAPMAALTLEVRGDDESVPFGSFALGDVCRVNIKDPLHPGGMLITKRLIGYEYYPASDDSIEFSRLSFEGEDIGE